MPRLSKALPKYRKHRWAVSKELIPVEVHRALATVPGLKQGKSNARETDRILPVDIEVVDATMDDRNVIVARIEKTVRELTCNAQA